MSYGAALVSVSKPDEMLQLDSNSSKFKIQGGEGMEDRDRGQRWDKGASSLLNSGIDLDQMFAVGSRLLHSNLAWEAVEEAVGQV